MSSGRPLSAPVLREGLAQPVDGADETELLAERGQHLGICINPRNPPDLTRQLKSDHTWRDTGVRVDARSDSTGDALSLGSRLYVLSRSPSSKPILNRLTYDSSKKLYKVDSGFPVAIGKGKHLFESIDTAPHLRLVDIRRFDSGVVILVYAPKGR